MSGGNGAGTACWRHHVELPCDLCGVETDRVEGAAVVCSSCAEALAVVDAAVSRWLLMAAILKGAMGS